MNKTRGFTYTHFQKAVFSSKKAVFKNPYFGGFCPLGHFFATFLVAPREAKKCELFSEWPNEWVSLWSKVHFFWSKPPKIQLIPPTLGQNSCYVFLEDIAFP